MHLIITKNYLLILKQLSGFVTPLNVLSAHRSLSRYRAIEVNDDISLQSKASDIWSLAVTFWEIFNKGEEPFAQLPPGAIQPHLISGHRLAPGDEAIPEVLYEIMIRCWHPKPECRFRLDFISSLNESSYCK
jgi:hypothetical protein